MQNNDWMGKGLGYYMDLNGRIFNEIHSISSVFLAFSNRDSTWNRSMVYGTSEIEMKHIENDFLKNDEKKYSHILKNIFFKHNLLLLLRSCMLHKV